MPDNEFFSVCLSHAHTPNQTVAAIPVCGRFVRVYLLQTHAVFMRSSTNGTTKTDQSISQTDRTYPHPQIHLLMALLAQRFPYHTTYRDLTICSAFPSSTSWRMRQSGQSARMLSCNTIDGVPYHRPPPPPVVVTVDTPDAPQTRLAQQRANI